MLRRIMFPIVFFLCCTLLKADDLYDAIKGGDIAKVKSLVEANPQIIDKEIEFHNYPLTDAILMGKLDIAKYLLEKGAKANVKNKGGETPLLVMVKEYGDMMNDAKLKQLTASTELLAQHKADFKAVNMGGYNALYILAIQAQTMDTAKNAVQLMKLFIDNGATFANSSKGEIPLNAVLALGGSPDGKGGTVYANLEIAAGMIGLGADVNAAGKDKRTPLIVILANKGIPDSEKIDIVKLLVEKGAKTGVSSKAGEKPLSLVDKKGPLYDVLKKGKGKPSK